MNNIDNYNDATELSTGRFPYAEVIREGKEATFLMKGDSMTSKKGLSIPEGSIIHSITLHRSHWRVKLPIDGYPFWVIYCQLSRAPLIKQIINHDIEKNEILCRSLNPTYPDFILSLNEVQALYYINEVGQVVVCKGRELTEHEKELRHLNNINF